MVVKYECEFKEIMKKYIMNGMCDYLQCFVTIMAYNVMIMHNNELKIIWQSNWTSLYCMKESNWWMVKWLYEMEYQYNRESIEWMKRIHLQWMDWYSYRNVSFSYTHWSQTFYTLNTCYRIANPSIDDDKCLNNVWH